MTEWEQVKVKRDRERDRRRWHDFWCISTYCFRTCVCTATMTEGMVIKLNWNFFSFFRPKNHHMWYESWHVMKWWHFHKATLWKAADGIFPPRASAQRIFNRTAQVAGDGMWYMNVLDPKIWKRLSEKYVSVVFLSHIKFSWLLYCDAGVHYHSSVCQLSQFHIQNGEFSMNKVR